MKRFIATFFVIVFAQTLCYAADECKSDSIKLGYQVYGNDTLFAEKFEYMISCGLSSAECETVVENYLQDRDVLAAMS